jgi:mannosyltransferase
MKRQALDLGVLLLTALVRVWGLGLQPLWMDEAFSHLFATLPLDLAWQAMIVDAVHPPLYYLLLRPWLTLAGDSEFALRFLSALAGVLTVALLLRVGRDWLGERAAGWAAFLLALNPLHVWYSQEARMYALLGFLSLAVLAAFWRVLRRRRRGDWAILGVLSALAYVTHYFALYLPLIEFVFLLATFQRYHQTLARWAAVQALAVLPLAGWLAALYTIAGGTFGIGWIPAPRLVA